MFYNLLQSQALICNIKIELIYIAVMMYFWYTVLCSINVHLPYIKNEKDKNI